MGNENIRGTVDPKQRTSHKRTIWKWNWGNYKGLKREHEAGRKKWRSVDNNGEKHIIVHEKS